MFSSLECNISIMAMKILAFINFLLVAGIHADPCPTACTWISWQSWRSCSSSCGGGHQYRYRHACCRGDATFDQCMSECHMRSSDSKQKRCCNTNCNNGGTWTYLDRANCQGRCTCTQGYKGNCCQTACRYIPNCLPNEIECNFLSERCLKCKPPFISTGWSGTCRRPICNPPCENNGTCISDDICDCSSGYIGERCSLGGSVDSYLLPTLNAVETAPFQQLSWYDRPPFSDFGRVCYIKMEVKDAPMETLLTAESLSFSRKKFGEFTTGPIDSNASLNSTNRTACLQMRCPSSAQNNDSQHIIVKIFPITSSGRCTVVKTNNYMNVTVKSNTTQHDIVTFQVDFGNNYGPAYGLYFGMGTREKAVFATRQQCLSGTNFNVYDINTSKGVLATFQC